MQARFLRFLFLLCNLANKRYIQILIAISEFHQFHLHFSVFTWCSSSFAHWKFVFIRYVDYGVLYVLLGRTFVFGLIRTKTFYTQVFAALVHVPLKGSSLLNNFIAYTEELVNVISRSQLGQAQAYHLCRRHTYNLSRASDKDSQRFRQSSTHCSAVLYPINNYSGCASRRLQLNPVKPELIWFVLHDSRKTECMDLRLYGCMDTSQCSA